MDDQNVWGWSDGSKWSYTNWSPGNPNNRGGMQDYVTINFNNPGQWDDEYKSTYPHPYICQRTLAASSQSK